MHVYKKSLTEMRSAGDGDTWILALRLRHIWGRGVNSQELFELSLKQVIIIRIL